jgi:hypothetical protein
MLLRRRTGLRSVTGFHHNAEFGLGAAAIRNSASGEDRLKNVLGDPGPKLRTPTLSLGCFPRLRFNWKKNGREGQHTPEKDQVG